MPPVRRPRNRRQHGSFGSIPVPHGRPAPQPALQGGEVGSTCQRRARSAWSCTVAIRSHAPRSMKQSEVRLFLRQKGQELAESSQDRQPGIPAVTVASPKQCDLPHHVRR